MNKIRLLAITILLSFTLCSCSSINNQVFVKNDHSLDSSTSYISEITSGKEEWSGEKFCMPEENDDDDKVTAEAALLYSLDETKAIYSKNVYKEMNPASITSLFTAYTALQNCDINKKVTVPYEAVKGLYHVSNIGLKSGDQVTIGQLIAGMILCSGVDAANALAISVGGTKSEFVKMMNKTAKDIGCVDSNFKNPNGLSENGHYTTAYDIYIIINKLKNNSFFNKLINDSRYKAAYYDKYGNKKEIEYVSTVDYIEDGVKKIDSISIVGGKTGTTSMAGHCLALIVKDQKGKSYLAVVLKAETHDSLYEQIEHIVRKIIK